MSQYPNIEYADDSSVDETSSLFSTTLSDRSPNERIITRNKDFLSEELLTPPTSSIHSSLSSTASSPNTSSKLSKSDEVSKITKPILKRSISHLSQKLKKKVSFHISNISSNRSDSDDEDVSHSGSNIGRVSAIDLLDLDSRSHGHDHSASSSNGNQQGVHADSLESFGSIKNTRIAKVMDRVRKIFTRKYSSLSDGPNSPKKENSQKNPINRKLSDKHIDKGNAESRRDDIVFPTEESTYSFDVAFDEF